jgi:protein SCO1/2
LRRRRIEHGTEGALFGPHAHCHAELSGSELYHQKPRLPLRTQYNRDETVKALFRLTLILYSCFAIAGTGQESLYQLKLDLTDQDGVQIGFDVFRGQPVLISMFYGSCPYVCPLTIHTIQKTEAALDAHDRQQLRVLLVSLDPEQDTPEKLAELARQRKVDTARWKLVRADAAGVRKLSAVLGTRFRKLPDGGFNHSTVIDLLDRNGVRVMQSNQLGQTDPELLQKIHALSQ